MQRACVKIASRARLQRPKSYRTLPKRWSTPGPSGARTALADWCGLDWQRRSFLPMHHDRHVVRFNGRQPAPVALLHGIRQEMLSQQLEAKGASQAATRDRLEAKLLKI